MMLKNENFDIYEIIKDNELQLLNLTGSELSWFCPVLYSMTFCLHVVLMRAECVCSPNTLYIHIYVCVCVCVTMSTVSLLCVHSETAEWHTCSVLPGWFCSWCPSLWCCFSHKRYVSTAQELLTLL